MRPRAGIDLDGVLYQWEPTARRVLEEHWGVRITESETWDWIREKLVERLGPSLGAQAGHWLFRGEGVIAGLWRNGEPYPGAVDAARKLALSHDVVIVTARPRYALRDTMSWLLFHGIYPTELIILPPGEGQRPKSSVLCDWYVDDSPANVEELDAAGRRAFLFDQPWNRACPAGERVSGWEDLMEKLRGTR